MFKIGWSKQKKEYYFWEKDNVFCNICRNQLEKQFILNTLFNQVFKETEQRSYCLTCFERVKKKLEGTHTLILIENPPKDLIPVIPDTLLPKIGKPANSVGGKILSDEDLKKEDPSQLDISRARISFNPNRNKMIDFEKNKQLADKRIKRLDVRFTRYFDGLDYLDSIKEANLFLSYTKIKRLESKKE